ncbi:MAG: hypothetical protein JXA14_14335 [Anaerolineae bacterium]|nr:hypothetical protein [Anaerolineae bacterium]
MVKRKKKESILRPEGVQKLLGGGGKRLTDDERALLLALTGVDAGSLSAEERAALDKLKAQVEGYDTEELAQAVEHMLTAEPVEGRKMEWPELKGRRKRRSRKK